MCGMVKNIVGLVSMSVFLSVFLSAFGRVKYMVVVLLKFMMYINGEWMLIICVVMCESGKYDIICNGFEVIVGLCKMFDDVVYV